MSAFTLEKPRPLGSQKGILVYRVQSGFILMDCLIEKLLAANLVAQNPTLPASLQKKGEGRKARLTLRPTFFPIFQHENWKKVGRKGLNGLLGLG